MSDTPKPECAWPLAPHHDTGWWAFVAVISTGIIVFCVPDRRLGDLEICARAKGHLAGRGLRWMTALGSCHEFQDECYPDLKSAQVRWPNLKDAGIPQLERSK